MAMKVLFKNLEKLSGQMENNAMERLDLPDIAAYQRIGGPVQHPIESVDHYSYPSLARSCGVLRSRSGPRGTIRVGLMLVCVT